MNVVQKLTDLCIDSYQTIQRFQHPQSESIVLGAQYMTSLVVCGLYEIHLLNRAQADHILIQIGMNPQAVIGDDHNRGWARRM